jgi:ATP-binding protein involved in chromosome partitioning
MPPGLGDATLDMIRLIDGIRFLVVTTPSRVAYETVRKLLTLLKRLNVPVMGVVENMVMKPSSYIKEQSNEDGIAHLGQIDFDSKLEDALGDVDRLSATMFYKTVHDLLTDLERSN